MHNKLGKIQSIYFIYLKGGQVCNGSNTYYVIFNAFASSPYLSRQNISLGIVEILIKYLAPMP